MKFEVAPVELITQGVDLMMCPKAHLSVPKADLTMPNADMTDRSNQKLAGPS